MEPFVPEDRISADDQDTLDEIAELEGLPTATVESWLEDDTPVTKWVSLRGGKFKVLVRGLTEEERAGVEQRAPKVAVRRGKTRVMEKDQQWINLEVVRIALIEPAVPDATMLKKALAGDLAQLATAIGEVSGFDLGMSDALD